MGTFREPSLERSTLWTFSYGAVVLDALSQVKAGIYVAMLWSKIIPRI